MSGFYQMPRGWMNHPALNAQRETFCRRAAFAWLVEEARFTDQEADISLGIPEAKTVKRGQVRHHIVFMAKAWGWDEAKVRRFLNSLSTANLIDYNCDGKQPVITIRNYSLFSPDRKNSDASATDLRSHSEPNYNKEIRKEGIKESPFNSPNSIGDAAAEPSLFGDAAAEPSAKTDKRKRRQIEYSEDFLRFWAINPNRGPDGHDKGRSYKNWKAAIAGGATAEILIDGWTNYVNGKRDTQDYGTQWIKSAQNFLDPENRMWLRFQSAPANNVAEFPDEPRWKTDPHGWSDVKNPPPWPDAPAGTHCGRWVKTSTRWMFQGAR